MSEEPKGPPKIDLDAILSEAESDDGAKARDEVQVVGMEAAADEQGEAASEDRAELEERLLRLRADFDNYRKRMERERADAGRRAVGELLRSLLPVLDNLERALKEKSGDDDGAFRQGVELIFRQAMEVLQRAGLEPIDAQGAPFDPHLHEAVERRATDEFPDQTVMEELLRGYQHHGKLLRAAMVRVAFHPAKKSARESGEE
jgi:molecular chaperone GrpE